VRNALLSPTSILQGPAHCYRRAANVFRNDVGNRSLLCVGADSEDPAICANAGECARIVHECFCAVCGLHLQMIIM
jgi:hypothetical protein